MDLIQLGRMHSVCFTGHRPEKLARPEAVIRQELAQQILQAVEDGFHTFISGMARGVDIWAAELVLQLRAQRPELRLVCACPYEGFETSWKQKKLLSKGLSSL